MYQHNEACELTRRILHGTSVAAEDPSVGPGPKTFLTAHLVDHVPCALVVTGTGATTAVAWVHLVHRFKKHMVTAAASQHRVPF